MPSADAPAHLPDAVRRRLLAVMTVWFCMALIDVGIVNVALPSIQHDLGATASDLQWILSGYALTFGAVLIAAGRAGDILGHGGLFLAGLAVFTAASLAAALAPSPAWLNAARFVEGIGAGGMSPQVYGMVQQYFHGAERGRAFGLLGMATSLSVAIAPPLGGALIALGGPFWGWRLTFLINVPLGAAGCVLAWLWFPRPLVRLHASTTHAESAPHGLLASLDVVGSLIAAIAVLALLLPFVEFHASKWVWAWLPVGLAAVWAWVAWERWYAHAGKPAMVDLKLFTLASFANGLTIQTLYFLGMTSVWVLVALYAQEAAGMSAFATGLLGVPSALLAATAAHWAGKRVARAGRKLVIAGQTVAVAGLALSALAVLAHAHLGISLWWLLATLGVYGLGQGATVSPNQTLTLAAVPVAYAGSAGALVSASQRVGAAVGIAVVTGVVFATLTRAAWSTATVAGFTLIAVLMLAAIGVGIRDLRHAKRS
ncbi:MAG: MFS transporter [Rhodanobacteraceae bacterium]|nr:MAG: MFS transporter [Rhodanobacteraceae bacterium]